MLLSQHSFIVRENDIRLLEDKSNKKYSKLTTKSIPLDNLYLFYDLVIGSINYEKTILPILLVKVVSPLACEPCRLSERNQNYVTCQMQ